MSSMGVSEFTISNRLLAALPKDEYQRLASHLELVQHKLGEVLHRTDDLIRYVYFPDDAVISLLTELEEGEGMEVGLVGKEGMAGISIALGVERSSKTATIQRAGTTLRMRASTLKEQLIPGGRLQELLLQYTHALMSQISQSVVCNTRHKAQGRLARWLLMFQDRAESDELFLTHEFMAHMLGVRRATVGEVAEELQEAGLIRYNRGQISILNRMGLIELTCECYPVVKAEFDRLYKS
jgi:CRP-like cAMP-binding protein